MTHPKPSKNTIDDQLYKYGDYLTDREHVKLRQALYQDLMDMAQNYHEHIESGDEHFVHRAIPVESINQYFKRGEGDE